MYEQVIVKYYHQPFTMPFHQTFDPSPLFFSENSVNIVEKQRIKNIYFYLRILLSSFPKRLVVTSLDRCMTA
jgi:hypothetical protein